MDILIGLFMRLQLRSNALAMWWIVYEKKPGQAAGFPSIGVCLQPRCRPATGGCDPQAAVVLV
jgi:hypothetical protein